MITRSTLALFAALLAFFSFVYTPIGDSDFWWHVASGGWMLEHHALPISDPFGVFPASDTVRSNTVLQGQWLGQIVMAALYNAGGTHVVIGFRALLLTLCLGLLYWRARRLGATRWSAWAVLLPGGLLALGFTGDRPQLFSYLFATLTWLVVEHYERHDKSPVLLLLPLIAMLWANIHGGFLLAVALLWLYVVACWFDARFFQRIPNPKIFALAWGATAFSAATLLTPNGFMTYSYLFDLQGSALQQATSEYRSSFALFRVGYTWPQAWVVTYYGLAVFACIGLFRDSKPRLILVLFLAVIAAWHYRYLAFLIFFAAPLISAGLSVAQVVNQRAARLEQAGAYTAISLAIFAIATGISNGRALHAGVDRELFPVTALEKIEPDAITGKVFNHMQWGGYLLSHLSPQARIYIDGRMLDTARLAPYTNMLWATPVGQAVFRDENFSWVMLPPRNRFTGERYALGDWLQGQPEWTLLFEDDYGLVFRRLAAPDRRG